jgi:hypothetical protein
VTMAVGSGGGRRGLEVGDDPRRADWATWAFALLDQQGHVGCLLAGGGPKKDIGPNMGMNYECFGCRFLNVFN